MTRENLQIDSAAITDKGLSEKRPQNEDSYLEIRDSGLYAVADGVGGAQAGDVASQMAVEILGEAFINLQEDGDVEERMKLAIQQANSAIFQTSHELSQLSTMATTIVVLHLQGNIATIGHVGDSRLYRLDEKGNLFRETQDHSVVEEEVRAGRMTPEQALTHPSRNVISRALGAEETVEIDMKTIMFEPNTKFLVCSDGVTRHISDDEIRDLLMEDVDSLMTCQTIKELCYQRGAKDNLTAVIVSIAKSDFDEFNGDFVNTLETFEEDTVATARTIRKDKGNLPNQENYKEIQTQQLRTPPKLEKAIQDSDFEEEEIVIPTRNDIGNDSISIPHSDSKNPHRNAPAKKDIKSYTVENNGGWGILGYFIAGVVWLLIGIFVGVLAHYFWAGSTSDPADDGGSQSIGVTKPIFDRNKRIAIVNPDSYVAANPNPQTSYDFYLLGLAYIEQGNFDNAKRDLEKAMDLLIDVPDLDKAVLKNDISLAMDKVNSGNNKSEAENAMPVNNIKQ